MKSLSLLFFCSLGYTNPKYAALVLNAQNGKVYFAQNADLPRHPASLTKMMTLYLLFEALNQKKISLQNSFLITERAASQIPSKLNLKPNSRISVYNSILALTVKSANDIAMAVAEGLGGSMENFVDKMNKKARQLGMKGTKFTNASGVPDTRQITTARDMAILGWALQRHFPRYYQFFKTKGFRFQNNYYKTHNAMLNTFKGMEGIKTGYINASGFNLVGSAMRYDRFGKGHRLIAVVMGGPNANWRNLHMRYLLEMGFTKINSQPFTPGVKSIAAPMVLVNARNNTPIIKNLKISIKPLPRPLRRT